MHCKRFEEVDYYTKRRAILSLYIGRSFSAACDTCDASTTAVFDREWI